MDEFVCKHTCDPCTWHYYDGETKTWKRCPTAELTRFYHDAKYIPAQYQAVTFDDFKIINENYARAKTVALNLVEVLAKKERHPKFSICITGKDLSGKTLLASAIVRALIPQKVSCCIVSLSVLVNVYFNTRVEFSDFFKYDVLCLQLGNEIANTSTGYIIRELFKERMQAGKYTFFTSRVFINDMRTIYFPDVYEFFKRDFIKEYALK